MLQFPFIINVQTGLLTSPLLQLALHTGVKTWHGDKIGLGESVSLKLVCGQA